MSNNQITIQAHHIHILEQDFTRDDFIDGIIAISKGDEPEMAGYGYVNDALAEIASGAGVIQQKNLTGLPSYDDHKELSPSWAERYRKVSRGWLPLNLQDNCSLKKLMFTNITAASKPELAQLEKVICDHFKSNPKTRQLEHWLRYIVEVMSFCVRGDLLDLDLK